MNADIKGLAELSAKHKKPHTVSAENAPQVYSWLQTRGGIRVWHSIDLSDPGYSVTTPADRADKPHWKLCNAEDCRIITDESLVIVVIPKEVKRFHVAIRQTGIFGMTYKCTAASSAKIRKACDKYGKDSWYQFEYETQEAVIFVPDSTQPIKQFMQYSDVRPCN